MKKTSLRIIILAALAAAFFGCVLPNEISWEFNNEYSESGYVEIEYYIYNTGINDVYWISLEVAVTADAGTPYSGTTDPIDLTAGDYDLVTAYIDLNGMEYDAGSAMVTGISWYPEDDGMSDW